jgi:hypothetical protein
MSSETGAIVTLGVIIAMMVWAWWFLYIHAPAPKPPRKPKHLFDSEIINRIERAEGWRVTDYTRLNECGSTSRA